MLNYRIVYPKGDRTKLTVCQVRSYEESDWAIASRNSYDNDEIGFHDAWERCRTLAKEHGLAVEDDPNGPEHDYLD